MPFIKLKQERGEYSWNGRIYQAGVIEPVSDKEAHYLVHEGIAVEISSVDKEKLENQIADDRKKNEIESKKVKIALVCLGGMGDTFLLACKARAVKRKYPNSEIVLYIRDAFDPINDMDGTDRVVLCGNSNWWSLIDDIKVKGNYDIILDCRYVTKAIYKDEIKFSDDKKNTDRFFKPYKNFYNEWIKSCSELSSLNVPVFDLFYKSTGYLGGEGDIRFPLKHEDFKFSQLLSDDKYVTVHNGSDIARQTKCWPTKHWNELVVLLKERGYKVVQLGVKFEEKIEGAINLCGMTSVGESAALLAKAKFHIDTEGGLVHLARGVNTRSVVIFGPTPVSCFGYESNINIEPVVECRGCWWKTDYWWRECPKGHGLPCPCMVNTKPKDVMEAVEKIEKMPAMKRDSELQYDPNDINERFAIELPLTEGHYQGERHQWDRINKMMEEVKGPKVLEVGAGDGYCSLVLRKRGFDVTPTEVSEIRLDRMRKAGLEPVKASVQNLPFPDASFDTVICGEVLEHIPDYWEGMKELERVTKPDGKIVISLPLTERYDGIKMHLWGVRFFPVMFEGAIDMGVFVYKRINR